MRLSERGHSPVSWTATLLFALMLALMLWMNVTRQSTDYGTGYGRFEDQVDSYSEYLIRNSVIERVRTGDIMPGYLVLSPGYADEDYSYSPGVWRRYFSNRGIQADLFAMIGAKDRALFLEHSSAYFQLFRFLNSLVMAVCIVTFFVSLFGRNYLGLSLALLFSLAGGIALFASNLYFMAWLLFMPLLCYPLVKGGRYGWYCGAALLSSLAYFSIRYEFATTFALLWILPVLVKVLNEGTVRWGYAIAAFLSSCAGFVVALLLHHLSVADALNVSLGEASRLIFVTFEMRVASLANVPAPLTPGFFKALLKRWDWTGFALPLTLSVSKLSVILLFLFLSRVFRRARPIFPILGWAVVAYISWYLFAYQHIMQHILYDSLIFAATIQLVVVLLIGIAVRDGLADGRWIPDRNPDR